jgi:hypothetical protein
MTKKTHPAIEHLLRPAIEHLLRLFVYDHLPKNLQSISSRFASLATTIAAGPHNPETTVALRKLLEAKDCAVRAVVIGDGG